MSKETWISCADAFKVAFDGRRAKKDVKADDDGDAKKQIADGLKKAIEMQNMQSNGIDDPPAQTKDNPFDQLSEVEGETDIKKKRKLRSVTSLIHYDL
jgi:hypothetical protein